MKLLKFLLINTTIIFSALFSSGQKCPLGLSWQWNHEGETEYLIQPRVVDSDVLAVGGRRIYRLNGTTGNIIWRYPTKEPSAGYFFWKPAQNGQSLFITGNDSQVIAIDLKTGQEKWRYRPNLEIQSQPELAGSFLVFSTKDSSIEALDAKNGNSVWRNPHRIFDQIYGQLATYQANVLGFTKSSYLYSLNIVTKKANWKTPLRRLPASAEIRPVVYNDQIYVIDGYMLIAFDAQTGSIVWQRKAAEPDEPIIENPVVSAYGIAITTQSGKLIVYDHDGTLLSKKPFLIGAGAGVKTIWAKNHVLIYDPRNTLQLVDRIESKLLWSYKILTDSSSKSKENNSALSFPAYNGDILWAWSVGHGLLAFDPLRAVDKTPPHITMTFPNPSEPFPTQATGGIFFQLDDIGSGVNPYSIKVFIDKAEKHHRYFLDGKLIIGFGEKSGNNVISNGKRVVEIRAADWFGNLAEKSFVIQVNNSFRY